MTSSLQEIMKELIDMGARWHPDIALFINNFGYIGLVLFCLFIGMFCRYISSAKKKDSIIYLTIFIILLQMISLPVGNFIASSSASILIVVLLLYVWMRRIFIIR